MGDLSSVIKQAAMEAFEASTPVNILPGTVIKINPLEINVDQRFPLPEDFLIVPERLTRYEVDLKHIHQYTDDGVTMTTGEALPERIVIRSGLQIGDKVILIRVQSGQQYVVFDKVG